MKPDPWNAFALIVSNNSTGDHLLGASLEMQKKNRIKEKDGNENQSGLLASRVK